MIFYFLFKIVRKVSRCKLRSNFVFLPIFSICYSYRVARHSSFYFRTQLDFIKCTLQKFCTLSRTKHSKCISEVVIFSILSFYFLLLSWDVKSVWMNWQHMHSYFLRHVKDLPVVLFNEQWLRKQLIIWLYKLLS